MITLPGPVNAHSHAFHRMLRGRTHVPDPRHPHDSFWTWRERMYALSAALDPDTYRELATAVYAEMVTAGWTAVGEFHYVHANRTDHAMDDALVEAALAAGIRLTLLDACYLRGGLDANGQDVPMSEPQRRFTDGSVDAWAERHRALRERFADASPSIRIGAAVHSVRAVRPSDLDVIAAALASDEVLHAHVSEQPAENEASVAATGLTPTSLLSAHGLVNERFTAVHATHLTDDDIALLGAARATVAFCPTTEADLGDGIGPARALVDAGAILALGSDQHAVIDPLLEARALEHGERLGSGRRARFSPDALVEALAAGGRRSLGIADAASVDADEIDVDADTVRTVGAVAGQIVLAATAADVREVRIGGRVVASDGVHVTLGEPAELYRSFLARHPEFA